MPALHSNAKHEFIFLPFRYMFRAWNESTVALKCNILCGIKEFKKLQTIIIFIYELHKYTTERKSQKFEIWLQKVRHILSQENASKIMS